MTKVEILVLVAASLAAVSAYIWANTALLRRRAWQRTKEMGTPDAIQLARSAYLQHLHSALLYVACAVIATEPLIRRPQTPFVGLIIVVPAILTFYLGRHARRDTANFIARLEIVRRAEAVFEQEDLATKRWAARLVPQSLPSVDRLEFASASHAASGMMTGDFLDVVELSPHRIAVVIGDAAGHGVDASIIAFQAKYVLRSFLRQYRDPSQVLDVLNQHMSVLAPEEELLSVLVAIIDTRANTLRYSSAGHCTCWSTADHEPVPIRSTGPLLMLDPDGEFWSREIPFGPGEVLLLYTDGVIESRRKGHELGTERVANVLRKELNSPVETLCKAVMTTAVGYSDGVSADDVTIFAVRRR